MSRPGAGAPSAMKSILLFLLFLTAAQARLVEYDLTVSERQWSPDGHRPARGIAINGSYPGPTLRFRVGDTARIRVHNQLRHEDTSIHWHGLLLPNAQDGVPGVTTPPILPSTTHTFEFPITHAGTYWYHSHTGLQEQIGAFGSIVIEPRGGEPVKAARDHVVMLSDWTRESPEEVMRTLTRGSEWYAFKKGSAQSLLGAARAGALGDFFDREKSRMPAMDISDIAYDAFLANGRESLDLPGRPGETLRLRFINAAASTYFYLESATGPLTIVAADGPAVRPIRVKRLFTGMAETYDVLVTVPPAGKWEIRATAQDGSGHTSIWIGEGERHPAPDVPKPDLYNMDAHLMAAIDDEPDLDSERPLSPYALLRSPVPTELNPALPRRTITLRATGDMERYVWSFNGKTFAEDGIIPIKKGEVLRIELINDTMMHHPMHLHGHFFRVLTGQGKYSPLKHTIDLPPMGRRTIEFEANDAGDWLFHCHLLYHMHAGMTRIFSYQDDSWQPPGKLKEDSNIVCNDLCCLPGDPDASTGTVDPRQLGHVPHTGGHDHDPLYFHLDGSVQSHMSEGFARLRNSRNDLLALWDIGYGDDDDSYEVDLAWSLYVNPNFSTIVGWRFTDHHGAKNRAFAGMDYRLPWLIDSSIQLDSEGDLRTGIGKSILLTDRLSVFAEVEYDTGSRWEWSAGADWLLNKQLSLTTQYHSDHGFGGGLRFRF